MGALDVVAWARAQGFPLDYIALFNPRDRGPGSAPKLSLTAPLYAARRRGLALPVPGVPIPASEEAVQTTLEFLRSVIAAKGCQPEYLCLVGGFDGIPTCP